MQLVCCLYRSCEIKNYYLLCQFIDDREKKMMRWPNKEGGQIILIKKYSESLIFIFLLRRLVAYSPGTGFPVLGGKFPVFPKTREFPEYSPFLFPVPVFPCSPFWRIYSPNFTPSPGIPEIPLA